MANYPVPGRGAWRLKGGLLPAKVGGAGRMGYYRLAMGKEVPIGKAWISGSATHDEHVVYLGVKAVQKLSGAVVDGWFGPDTLEAVVHAQGRLGVEADGIVGPSTMRAALEPLVRDACAAHGVPVSALGGILAHESSLDPAAVGVNGTDHGLAQINLSAHSAQVSLENAMDPEYAIGWTAEDLGQVHDVWEHKTKADPWDIAIAHHNSPLLAKNWATTGTPPVVANRSFQIQDYVEAVKAAW
jgi:hypothetical protein